jgi:hypothetical protein
MMNGKSLSLASLLMLSAAMPLWISLTYIVITSYGFGRLTLAPIALVIASVAIYLPLRGARHAAALSTLLAGLALHGALSAAMIWERFFS